MQFENNSLTNDTYEECHIIGAVRNMEYRNNMKDLT